jgi:hypothetical protein
VSSQDIINAIHADAGFDDIHAALGPGDRLGITLAVQGHDAVVLLAVTASEEGPVVSVQAYTADGNPAELGRIESGELGQMLLHVLT